MTIPGISRHARERMQERHGRDLTRDEWLRLVLDILDGRSCMLHASPPDGSGELHLIQVGAVQVRVLWQPMAGVVTTVLADGDSPSRAVDAAKRSGLRASVIKGGGWRRGKRVPVKVLYQ